MILSNCPIAESISKVNKLSNINKNKEKNKAIENPECICFKCLKNTIIHTIQINQTGYGSNFDGLSTKIQLCDDCYKSTNPNWWELKTIPIQEYGEDFFEYEYENEILNFVNQMPLAGQELFWNRYVYGARVTYYMEAQDWIDYELGILSEEKCMEYGLNIEKEN